LEGNVLAHSVILTGPTGSGKSELAIELASRIGAEIVSMDSMSLYRGMDIGTAKPSLERRGLIAHHLIDVLDPWESASVAWWLGQAKACVRDIEARGKRALIVGGTPLYLKILLRGLFRGPPANEEIRARLREESQQAGVKILHDRLREVDPAAARKLHPQDVRRVIRALEVWELTGRPISGWQSQWHDPQTVGESKPLVLCLELPRPDLYARINQRVECMFAEGLVDEADKLRRLPRPISREAAQALGYKEVFSYLDSQATLSQTVQAVQTRSRNFAKRQLTWFRSLPECRRLSRELTFAALGLTMKG
jgi:tRNA dimethylallyltransferase